MAWKRDAQSPMKRLLLFYENNFLIFKLHDAAKLSNCLEFIQKFPDGFDTMVGEHGASMLSGGFQINLKLIINLFKGQRQRIAIARALINVGG